MLSIECPCGEWIESDDEAELAELVGQHIGEMHPEMFASYSPLEIIELTRRGAESWTAAR